METLSERNASVSPEKSTKRDVISGFLVFLIALPLCLGISLASGYPAVAGIFTAIVGGIFTSLISNSELTIKGPAAGLIVIALGCVADFGFTGGRDPVADFQAYKLALGVGAAAAVFQILFGLLRSGVLGEFFPVSTVHGMLAAIGVIIMAKQIPIALGTTARGEPLELLAHLPDHFAHMNPEIAAIGAISLVILFGYGFLRNRYLRMIPAPMIVVLVAIPLGYYFDLSHEHTYSMLGHSYKLGENYLVSVPLSLISAITFPDFSGLATAKAWKWVAMFALVGSLESMLSAKAVDLLDPYKRKTSLDRDLVAIGVGNLIASLIGGLPMISEIVRSRANIDNGATTRKANVAHGVFLLLAVALLPHLIHRIPLAALAAMLVYTGFRLAHPREFLNIFRIGREQLIIYSSTIVAVLMTDLLVGVFVGVGVKVIIHLCHGLPLKALFKNNILGEPVRSSGDYLISMEPAAIFTHWIPLRKEIVSNGLAKKCHVVVDLSRASLVDHTVMEKLHELQREFHERELKLSIIGLQEHVSLSEHPLAARRKPAGLSTPGDKK